MELTINLEYEQILKLVRQLPYSEKKKLSLYIMQELNTWRSRNRDKSHDSSEGLNEFQKILLDGPKMTDEQFEHFNLLRKDFNRWLEK